MNPESKDESNRRPRKRYRCPTMPILRMANQKTLEERNLPHRKALEELPPKQNNHPSPRVLWREIKATTEKRSARTSMTQMFGDEKYLNSRHFEVPGDDGGGDERTAEGGAHGRG
jgi:hypothetical protein